jgi:hypothetical protein
MEGVADALPTGDIGITRRFERALQDIISGYEYMMTVVSHTANATRCVIKKESTRLLEDNSVSYSTSDTQCDCPDFEKARGNLCKHRLAVMIVRTLLSTYED